MRVLIADDNHAIRSALALALTELVGQTKTCEGDETETSPCSCTIFEASTAEELHARLSGAPLDLLFLDWELPGFDGLPTLSVIGAQMPECRVVAMSGDPEARERASHLGVQHFVGRNDPPSKLLQLLAELWPR